MEKLYIIGEFNEKMVENLKETIYKFPSDLDKLYVYIDSDGGDSYALEEIIKLLKPFEEKLTTVALKSCKSAATFIFLLGVERLVIEECEFMVHRPACSDLTENERITLPILQRRIAKLKHLEKWMRDFYKTHHVPNDLIKHIFSTERDVTVTLNSLISSKMATGVCKVDYNIIL